MKLNEPEYKFRIFKDSEKKVAFIRKCQENGTYDGHCDVFDHFGVLTGYQYVRYRNVKYKE